MTPEAKTVSVVMPVFNKSELTDRCLDSLLKHSHQSHEIFVIDNASTDDTPAKLIGWQKKFEARGWKFVIQRNSQNVGFGRAMNQGARLAQSPFLALINNDIWISPLWDQILISDMQKHAGASLICPHIDESKPFLEARLLDLARRFQERNANRCLKKFCAVFLFFRTADFFKIGAFDERYFVTYEDTDLRERMDRGGFEYWTVGDCLIWHQSMSTRGSQLKPGYEVEGKALFVEKWGFDPSEREKTRAFRWRRKWEKWRHRLGFL